MVQKDAFTYILSMFCDFCQVIKQRKKPLNTGFLHVFHLFVCKWIFYIGAPDKIWTCTIAHTPLKRARLPIPPLVHIFIINSCNKMSMWL